MYKVGDTITYQAFDEESYSRGYGCHYETKTAKITEIRYRMENNDEIARSQLLGQLPETIKEGDLLNYEIWDGEEGRGYGWFKANKKAKILYLLYKTDKYDTVKETEIHKKNQLYTIGSQISYKELNARVGYNSSYDIKSGKITGIRYIIQNFDFVSQSDLCEEIPESIKVGDIVNYKIVEKNESNKKQKSGRVSQFLYEIDNQKFIEESLIQPD